MSGLKKIKRKTLNSKWKFDDLKTFTILRADLKDLIRDYVVKNFTKWSQQRIYHLVNGIEGSSSSPNTLKDLKRKYTRFYKDNFYKNIRVKIDQIVRLP